MNQRNIAAVLISLSVTLSLPFETKAQAVVRTLLGPTPYECKTNNPCSTNITVTAGESKPDGTVDPNGCTVSWGYNGYLVKRFKHPKLVWKLVYTGVDTYKFDPNDGVILNPADMNEPDQDLYDQGLDSADGQKFKWHDRNRRKREKHQNHPVAEEREIRFDFVVLRDRDNQKCAAGDPVVINMGQ